jgi:hypothetical protein
MEKLASTNKALAEANKKAQATQLKLDMTQSELERLQARAQPARLSRLGRNRLSFLGMSTLSIWVERSPTILPKSWSCMFPQCWTSDDQRVYVAFTWMVAYCHQEHSPYTRGCVWAVLLPETVELTPLDL